MQSAMLADTHKDDNASSSLDISSAGRPHSLSEESAEASASLHSSLFSSSSSDSLWDYSERNAEAEQALFSSLVKAIEEQQKREIDVFRAHLHEEQARARYLRMLAAESPSPLGDEVEIFVADAIAMHSQREPPTLLATAPVPAVVPPSTTETALPPSPRVAPSRYTPHRITSWAAGATTSRFVSAQGTEQGKGSHAVADGPSFFSSFITSSPPIVKQVVPSAAIFATKAVPPPPPNSRFIPPHPSTLCLCPVCRGVVQHEQSRDEDDDGRRRQQTEREVEALKRVCDFFDTLDF